MTGPVLSEQDIVDAGGDPTAAWKKKQEQGQREFVESGGIYPVWASQLSGVLGRIRHCSNGNRKFADAQEYIDRVFTYFETCVSEGWIPSPNGLAGFMGFRDFSRMKTHAMKNPDMVEPFSQALALLKIPLEHIVVSPDGMNSTGAWKMLQNVPSGWGPDEDPRTTPLRYEYKERRTEEVTGAGGAPLQVTFNEGEAAAIWDQFKRAGARLAVPAVPLSARDPDVDDLK